MIEILRRGDIHAQAPEEMGLYPFPGFSINATQWPADAYLIFPFEKVKELLRPTFYIRIQIFTLPVNNFHFCHWTCIHFAELVCERRVPVSLASTMYLPRPNAELEKLCKEKGISVTYQFETEMSKWTERARRFAVEYQQQQPFDPSSKYLPKFVMNYNLKLAEIYGIDWSVVERREKEMLEEEEERFYRLEEKSSNPDARGTCYQDAYHFVQKQEGLLIHGQIFSPADKRFIQHAWVDLETGWMWEPETKQYFRKEQFDEVFKPKVEATYSRTEAAIKAVKSKHYGPWESSSNPHFPISLNPYFVIQGVFIVFVVGVPLAAWVHSLLTENSE